MVSHVVIAFPCYVNLYPKADIHPSKTKAIKWEGVFQKLIKWKGKFEKEINCTSAVKWFFKLIRSFGRFLNTHFYLTDCSLEGSIFARRILPSQVYAFLVNVRLFRSCILSRVLALKYLQNCDMYVRQCAYLVVLILPLGARVSRVPLRARRTFLWSRVTCIGCSANNHRKGRWCVFGE